MTDTTKDLRAAALLQAQEIETLAAMGDTLHTSNLAPVAATLRSLAATQDTKDLLAALDELRAHCLAAVEFVGSHNSADREREAKAAVRARFAEVAALAATQQSAHSAPEQPSAGVEAVAWMVYGEHGLCIGIAYSASMRDRAIKEGHKVRPLIFGDTAPPSVLVALKEIPREVLELTADIGIEDQHDDNGPGRVFCHACGESSVMRWESGRRLDVPEDVPHSAHCPAKWAQAQLATSTGGKG